jgi:hypothetical protein
MSVFCAQRWIRTYTYVYHTHTHTHKYIILGVRSRSLRHGRKQRQVYTVRMVCCVVCCTCCMFVLCRCVSIQEAHARYVCLRFHVCVCVRACVCCVCVGALMYRAPGMPRSQENVSELMYLCGILRATRVLLSILVLAFYNTCAYIRMPAIQAHTHTRTRTHTHTHCCPQDCNNTRCC